MRTPLPLMLAAAFLACIGCDGGSSSAGAPPGVGSEGPVDIPSPFGPFAPPMENGEGPGAGGDVAGPVSLNLVQIKSSGVDCGEAISGTVQASGGTGDFSWQVVNLPAWASATPTGERGGSLVLGGTVPYETCDEGKFEVNPKVCDAAGDRNDCS